MPPSVAMHGRARRLPVVAVTVAAVAVLVLLLQYFNTVKVRDALCARVSNQTECEAETTLASLELPWNPGTLPAGVEVTPLRPRATTSLVRRTCDGRWTMGVGARIDVIDTGVTSEMVQLRVGRACVDTDGNDASGVISNAVVTSRGCGAEFAPIRFSAQDALQASLTATVAPATVPACALLFRQQMRAEAAAALAGASLALEVRYGANRAPQTESQRSVGSPGAPNETTRGLTSRLFTSIDTSHDLAVTLAGGRASVHLDTEPAGDSAVLTLSVKADSVIAALLPDDMRPSKDGPVALEVRWNLNHETGEVRVNGEAIKRTPVEATRAEGRVVLGGSECEAASTGRERALFFVEAGDRGEALRAGQLAGVFTAVDGAAARAGALVTVFVHGWHHSASPGDAYVCRVAEVLGSVDEMEVRAAGLAGRPARQVIGIYVGWPGALYPNALANSVTTFWNRLVAADRLGGDDAPLKRLLAGLSERLAASRAGPRADRRSSLVVVGHSMGARAVFNALHDDLQGTRPVSGQALGPDLVLLVNPAFSATLYRELHEQHRACTPGQAPVLLFSSEADSVTRQMYPAGQTVTYPYSQRDRAPFLEYVYTAPNFAEFVTHRLRLETVRGDPPDAGGVQTILRGFERIPSGSKELYSDNPVVVFRQPTSGRPRATDVWYRMQLVDVLANPPDCAAATVSKVIEVDRQILPDHGTIFTPPFVEYIVRVLNRRALDSFTPR